MYKTLLQFYLQTMAIFQGSRSNVIIAMGILKSGSKRTLDSFNTFADDLEVLLRSETYVLTSEVYTSTKTIEDALVDALSKSIFAQLAVEKRIRRKSTAY